MMAGITLLHAQNYHHNESTKHSPIVIPDTEIERESELNWKDYDIPDKFPELQILEQLDPAKAEKYLKAAKHNYDIALKIIHNAREEVKKVPEEYKHLPENYYWQIQEKQEKIRKKQNLIMTKAYRKAKIYIIKGLENLEQIRSPKILQTEYFIHLRSNLLRHFVLLQLSLRDISGIIPSIEEYFSLRSSHKKEAQPYKILAYCYQYMERISKKSHASEKIVEKYKKLKYKNLLTYVILKYGKNSTQYQYLRKKIERNLIKDIL